MRFSSRKPVVALTPFVDNFWLYEGYEAEHANERILPTGTIELVINLRENALRIYDQEHPGRCSHFSGAVFSGPYGKGFVSDSQEEAFIVGTHFKPGGAFPFLGVPAHEISDTHIDLDTLWGPSAALLREQLCEASTAEEVFDLLEKALISHLFRPIEAHYAVSAALEAFDKRVDATVQGIAKSVGLSERRLIEVFKSEVGMTPKLFSRVQRFQRARAMIHRQEERPDWVGIAADCGYFDQSHMIRDFREFTGISPTAYLEQYDRFVQQNLHIKRFHFPLSSKLGQFYPIHQVSPEDIISLGGDYVLKQ